MSDQKHHGLPVAGYRPQTDEALALVNANKDAEERVLRILDSLATRPDIDKRWLAVGRTAIENGFMAVNRAVFQPARVALSHDTKPAA
ncbi:Acb2/Tad1 domain-containing protein [Methylobacterium fujisawaense]|uniref:Acb2/Tad1 domain-containing protein n=1 Tax=Methylobacterium fujisawaense TaxID=107400 RepID=UPI003700DE46